MVFLVGYLGESVEAYFGNGNEFGIRAHYSHEAHPLGRGGALRAGFEMLGNIDGPVFATNGDVITAANPATLLNDYNERINLNASHVASILTVPMVSPYGIVDTDDSGRVRQFREKAALPYTINGGVYVLNTNMRELLPEIGDHETTTFPSLAATGRMSAVPTDEFWRSVDSPKDLHETEEYLSGRLLESGQASS